MSVSFFGGDEPPFWVTVIGVGGCGTQLVVSLQQTYGRNFYGLEIWYKAADCDAMPRQLAIGERTPSWVHWEWCNEVGQLPYQSCNGNPALARTADWRAPQPEIAEVFHFRKSDALIILAGFGKGAGTGISQVLAAQAAHAKIPLFVLVTLPFQNEKLSIDLAAEMSLLESVADAVFYFDQDCPRGGLDFPPDSSISELMSMTDARIDRCFNELLKGMLSICFRGEGRCGHGIREANGVGEFRDALFSAILDAQQMAGIKTPRHGFIRVSHPPGVQSSTVWDELKSGLIAIPNSRSMAFEKSIETDDSLVDKIVISVFMAWGASLPSDF